jgi:hypothetical protein
VAHTWRIMPCVRVWSYNPGMSRQVALDIFPETAHIARTAMYAPPAKSRRGGPTPPTSALPLRYLVGRRPCTKCAHSDSGGDRRAVEVKGNTPRAKAAGDVGRRRVASHDAVAQHAPILRGPLRELLAVGRLTGVRVTPVQPFRVGEAQGVIADIRVPVEALRIHDVPAHRVRRQPAALSEFVRTHHFVADPKGLRQRLEPTSLYMRYPPPGGVKEQHGNQGERQSRYAHEEEIAQDIAEAVSRAQRGGQEDEKASGETVGRPAWLP